MEMRGGSEGQFVFFVNRDALCKLPHHITILFLNLRGAGGQVTTNTCDHLERPPCGMLIKVSLVG